MKKTFGLALILGVLGLVVAGCSTNSTNTGTGNLNVLVLSTVEIPLAGAKVVSNTQPEGQLKVTGITGDNGTVTFNSIKEGEYEFYVSRFDYVQQEFAVAIKPGQTPETTIIMAPN
jgi:hypothetical protein